LQLSDRVEDVSDGAENGLHIEVPHAGLIVNMGGRVTLRDPRDGASRSWSASRHSASGARPLDSTITRSLIGRVLTEVSAKDHIGELCLTFADGSTLLAESEPDFEAWDLQGVNGELRGLRLVCMPGGDVAFWSPDGLGTHKD
jgi:hypothetical protein